MRGRSDGDWYNSEHRQRLELRGEISNSITSVLKDNMLYEEYTDQGEHEERIPGML